MWGYCASLNCRHECAVMSIHFPWSTASDFHKHQLWAAAVKHVYSFPASGRHSSSLNNKMWHLSFYKSLDCTYCQSCYWGLQIHSLNRILFYHHINLPGRLCPSSSISWNKKLRIQPFRFPVINIFYQTYVLLEPAGLIYLIKSRKPPHTMTERKKSLSSNQDSSVSSCTFPALTYASYTMYFINSVWWSPSVMSA